ncbi:MAG: dicarboxylate/amino acid:cation symporter [Candidatus Hinthialibacter antarcticus]|nr:dicarboxylate/amino acid:cation symporter [Candidatus Hinthialibacter antarcticus]
MSGTNRFSENLLLIGIVIGVVLGIVCGAVFGEKMLAVAFIGDMFMNALKAVMIPLIMASMIVGVASLGDLRKLGRLGGVTVLYYLTTTTIAVVLGVIMIKIFNPGEGIQFGAMELPEAIRGKEFSFIDLIMGFVPSNIFQSMAEGQILPLIISTLLFGGVLTTLGEKGKPVLAFFEGLDAAMMKIVVIIMWFAPIGVFALIAATLGKYGGGEAVWTVLKSLGWFVATVLTGLFVHAFVVIPTLLYVFAKRNPITYFMNMLSAVMTAFSTASSAATLPLTMRCVEENNNVNPQVSGFVLPLGATINMDGTAFYEAAGVLFIASAYGFDLAFGQQMVLILTAVLASIGAAAIPHAGLITMVLVLSALGLPIEGIALIFPVDWFLDRFRTAVNIWGDSVGAAVVEHQTAGYIDMPETQS